MTLHLMLTPKTLLGRQPAKYYSNKKKKAAKMLEVLNIAQCTAREKAEMTIQQDSFAKLP